MDIEKKIDLVKRTPTEEIVTEADLRKIFENYAHPKHYIGFEISGMVHLGTGLCTALKIKDFLEAGINPTIFLADYHSYINQKLGGDLENIQKVAKGYFKHAFVSLGLDESKVKFVLASELYDNDYWKEVLKITKDTTINRMLRCVTIMGRKETEATSSAAIVYPAMQAADLFMLDVQIAHAGMDQRKVHMLARELSHSYKKEFVAVHGHLLPGLKGPQRMSVPGTETKEQKADAEVDAKMSKSKPDSAVFIHDSALEIRRKVSQAFCPEGEAKYNPILDWVKYLVFYETTIFTVKRDEKWGGDLNYNSYEELEKDYLEKNLHPQDLKAAVAEWLIKKLEPARIYFEDPKRKAALEEIEKLTIK